MIKFKNSYFVKNNNEIINSCFKQKTASGTYKKYKHFILLKDITDEPICYIQKNGMIGNASYTDNKKIFRQYDLTSSTEETFFNELKEMKYSDRIEYIKNIYSSI